MKHNLQHRYYEKEFPEVGDLVMVKVSRIDDLGVYGALLEYCNREGMLMISELSSRRVRSIYKLVRIGKVYTLVVLGVNREKGFIDLSKKRLDATPEERLKYDNRYNNAKALNSIISYVASRTQADPNMTSCSMEDLYKMFGFEMLEQYETGNNLFKLAAKNPDQFLERIKIPEDIRELVMSNLKRKLTPQVVKIRGDVGVTCEARAGIDAIKESFKAALEVSTKEYPIQITLIGTPLYMVVCSTLDKEEGIIRVKKAIQIIREEIEERGGRLEIKKEVSTELSTE